MQDLEASSTQTKRLVIWVIACLVVFIGWSAIAPRPIRAPLEVQPAATAAPEAVADPLATLPANPTDPVVVSAADTEAIAEESPRRVEARTPAWSVELSNVGGRLTSWKLLEEGDYGDPARPLELVRRDAPPPLFGEDTETAPQGGALEASDSQAMLPLQVLTGDAALDALLASAVHEVSSEETETTRILTARWADGTGTAIEKILTLHVSRPLATIEARLSVAGRPAPFRLAWGPGIANHTGEEHSNLYFRRGNIASLATEKVRTVERPDKQDDLPSTPQRWVAMQDSYFTVLFSPLPLRGEPGSVRSGMATGYRISGEAPLGENGKVDKRQWPEAIVLEVPFTPQAPVQAIYAGARHRQTLKALEGSFAEPPRLSMLAHLGMLDGLARLLHVPMLKFHEWTKSWGWSVVLLTLLVRIVIAPLQFMSMKKMRGMQDKMRPMQAKLKALDERWKKQPPTRENRMKHMQEKQELMLQAGINPADTLSGCLPLLITMPVFFALLKLLPNAPEFRHESFLLWKDLAAADPTHLLPIAAAVLTLISTKMAMSSSSQTVDPLQRNMLYMFPLMLVWLCWSAPLAFVVYQVAMSAVQIGQQYLFNMALPPMEAAPAHARDRPGKDRAEPKELTAGAATVPVAGAGAARKKGRKR